ncbi:MAG: polymorphic toxin-type HINT domain-containing protein, partial [Isosphaeraceae bacterium]
RTEIPIGRLMVEYQKTAIVAQQQLANDVAAVEAQNAEIKESNGRLAQILQAVSGQNRGEDRDGWKAWWIDILGYSYSPPRETPKPTFVQNVPLAYQPQPVSVMSADFATGPPKIQTSVSPNSTVSCFAAGTLVRTLSGPRPIEDIQVGDRLLTRDTESGALSYQPVLVVHHNPPSKTLRINLENEAIVSSVFHRFWRAGKGWAMARDLQPGDTLRTLSGQSRVVSVEEDQVQPVFNLDVAENRTFFVGQAGTLVHDNTVPSPRDRRFDVPPTLVSRQGD